MKRTNNLTSKIAAAFAVILTLTASFSPVFASEAANEQVEVVEEEESYRRLCTTEVFELPASQEVSHTAVIAAEVLISQLF